MENSNTTSYAVKTRVVLPPPYDSFTIDSRDWARLKDVVEDFHPHVKWWEMAASALFGGSLSAFITRLSLVKGQNNATVCLALLIAAIACLLMAVLCIIAAVCQRDKERMSIEAIKRELSFIEAKKLKPSSK